MTRRERIMLGAANYCAYYRHNVHRFAHDYLHLDLKLFQKILLVMMNAVTTFVFIGARGIGKSFLSAVFCVIRCVLWPGTKIAVASGTRGQAVNIIEKIMLELVPNSPELAAEIDMKQTKTNGTEARIIFHNTSYIKVVTASDSARGNRANVLLIDEFRLVNKDVIDTILRKFLTQKRMPKYAELNKDERRSEYAKEKNLIMYLSSAYWAEHWSFTKCVDTYRAMMDERRRQFVCGLPYQLSIEEGLLDEETVASEMSEADFSEVKFSMEYCALFYDEGDGSYFDYKSVSKNRFIKYPMLPSDTSSLLKDNQAIRIQPKVPGEIRLISADIALMSSKKRNNDATSIFINQMLPTKSGRYTNNIVYCDAMEGLRTDAQALAIRKLYDEYQCDYIVLDTQGIGLGVYDALAREISDPETGEIYPALSCCNDTTMAERCTSPSAEKVIWSIKAGAAMNSECATLLREGFRSGRIRLLVTEDDADGVLGELKGYKSLPPNEQMRLQMPYIHTSLLINELVKLQRDEKNQNLVKLVERSGMRKDRYSSLAYNFYVASQLEAKNSRRQNIAADNGKPWVIRAPNYNRRKVVSDRFGRHGNDGWQ